MYSLEELTQMVDKGIKNLTLPKEPKQLYEPITYTLSSGGKRIRPVLVLAACNAFSDSIDKAIHPALAIELFHNFTLIHDDIMDNAPIRRGNPTVFSKWGSNIAILSGDTLNILAYQLIAKTPAEHLPQVLKLFNCIGLGVCDGQQYDLNFETSPVVTEEEYLRMIELKTSVLLNGSAQIGATIGKASQKDIDLIGDFAKNLGMAFQLQDDLLDSFGNPNAFGKKIGGDILENKKTFLTIKAFNLATGKDLEQLNHYFKTPDMNPQEKIDGVINIYKGVGVEQVTEEKIGEYSRKAQKALEQIDLPIERKGVLNEMAEKIVNRKS